ncbi:hypothetical protein L3Q82_025501 [Scortum barcoo]|uniref:Uncharacterized protein n=1 Tax=Scortum barcoo TaxID=214431 RepID=A0ACB8WL73_9TELE|nr:hypothetical protein L3Q82_025501 [Scortum barcoo]
MMALDEKSENYQRCPKLAVQNGFVVSFSDRVYYSCNENYKLFTKGWWGEAKCIDQHWTGLERCIEKEHCGKIPAIPNGRVIQQTRRFYRQHESVQILCKEGYRAHLQQLTCHEGKWNSNELQLQNICTPSANSCNPPPRVANAVVLEPYQKRYAPNSEVTYRCRDTYTAEGEEKLRCKNGEWENSIKCIQYCDRFKEEKQAMTFTSDKDRYSPGEKIHYQCTTINDNGIATCVNGQWNKSIECEEYCDQFREKRQAMTFTSDKDRYSPGEKIHYQCTTINDNGIATCINGQWNKSIECEGSNCDPPPANGEITVNGLPENDDPILPDHIITFSCDSPGKHLSGSSVLKCGDDGRWNNTFPSCEDITCKLDKMDPHITVSITPSPEPIKIGHKLLFQCDNRYTLEGSKETACLETGQWSAPFPTCSEKMQSKVPGVPANVLIDRQVPNNLLGKGQSLKFRCRRYDHVIQGNAEVECLGNGQWSHPFPTCGRKSVLFLSPRSLSCEMMRNPTFRCLPQCTATEQVTVKYFVTVKDLSLKILNSLEHPLTSYCMHGKPLRSWKNARRPPSSLFNRIAFFTTLEFAACLMLPDVPHAHVSKDTKKAEYQEGDIIHFTCETEYTSSQTSTYVCLRDGWLTVRQGTCYSSGSNCDPPPANGEITVNGLPENDDPILPDHIITFSCDSPGKHLSGSSVLKCGDDGRWNNTFPSCEEKCKVPGVLANVLIDRQVPNNLLGKGQSLKFRCRRYDHVIQGNAEVECLGNGQWSHHTFPTCGPPVGCQRPPPLEGGDTRESTRPQYRHNERVEYVCQSFYTLEGDHYKTCINGEWTGQTRCLKPCIVDREAMSQRNIAFRYSRDDKLYSAHNDEIQFSCTSSRGRPVDGVVMRQRYQTGSLAPTSTHPNLSSVVEITCTVPRIENGYVPGDIKVYRENEILQFECNNKYAPTEGRPSKCIKIGSGAEWSPTPICEQITCDREEVENAVHVNPNKQTYKYNEQAEYRCKDGYKGSPTRTCGGQGWTETSGCTEPCTVTAEEMRQRKIAFRYDVHDPTKLHSAHNDVIEFQCAKRIADGPMRRQCNNGVMVLPSCQ